MPVKLTAGDMVGRRTIIQFGISQDPPAILKNNATANAKNDSGPIIGWCVLYCLPASGSVIL
jgi:hypothetical protein